MQPQRSRQHLDPSATRAVVALVTTVLLSAGCSVRIGDLTALSTHNIALETVARGDRLEGRDCTHWLFGLLPVSSPFRNIDAAVEEALSDVPRANALMNVALYEESTFLLIYSRSCIRVSGDAVQVFREGEVR